VKLELEIPTTLPSLANLREHPMARHRRAQKIKGDVALVVTTRRGFDQVAAAVRELGATIVLTRIAVRRYDRDNLAAAFKHVQDGIAAALQVNDGDRRLDWRYEQESGRPDRVRVSIETPAGPPQ
jgi:predicted RNA-binding Zn ribbon-like protein